MWFNAAAMLFYLFTAQLGNTGSEGGAAGSPTISAV